MTNGKILSGLKDFILRGNVVDMAIGIMIGAAFTSVINALVKDIFTPIIGAIFKASEFSNLFFTIHGSRFLYGDFINAVISFLIIATVLYFFVVLPMTKLIARLEGPKPAETKTCPECASSIPINAKRCAHCTQLI